MADRRERMVISWEPLRGRPGLTSVLAVVWAQYVMIGVLDIVLVVLARTELDLGDAGPGLLSTVFGRAPSSASSARRSSPGARGWHRS